MHFRYKLASFHYNLFTANGKNYLQIFIQLIIFNIVWDFNCFFFSENIKSTRKNCICLTKMHWTECRNGKLSLNKKRQKKTVFVLIHFSKQAREDKNFLFHFGCFKFFFLQEFSFRSGWSLRFFSSDLCNNSTFYNSAVLGLKSWMNFSQFYEMFLLRFYGSCGGLAIQLPV